MPGYGYAPRGTPASEEGFHIGADTGNVESMHGHLRTGFNENMVGIDAGFTGGGFYNDPGANAESGFWGGAMGFDANLDVFSDTNQTAVGATANILDLSAGYRTVDKDSDNDRGMRGGLSVGYGFGGRAHHSDVDNDGNTEYGFGFDIPTPWGVGVSMDYTTETPMGDLASMALAGPFAPAMMGLNAGMDAVGLGEYAPGSLLSSAGSAIGSGVSAAASFVGGVFSGW